jgi:ribosomal protein L37AE/L43A
VPELPPNQTDRCPHCGCNDIRPAKAGAYACGHCGRTFRIAVDAGDNDQSTDDRSTSSAESTEESDAVPPRYRIVRERLRCPACRSTDFKTDTTRPETPEGSVLRYHVCRCGNRFSSLER